MARSQVRIATTQKARASDPDLGLLVGIFDSLNVDARVIDWQSDPSCELPTLIRSCWGYHRYPNRFSKWYHSLRQCENSVEYLEWNIDKKYLLQLSSCGIQVVPTAYDVASIKHLPVADEYVIKPRVSAGAEGIITVTRSELNRASQAKYPDAMLAQPRIRSQDDDPTEISIVLVNGTPAHAIRRAPALNPANDLWQLSRQDAGFILDTGVFPLLRQSAVRAVDAAQYLTKSRQYPLYARADYLITDDDPLLLELELIEPALLLFKHQEAARQLCIEFLKRNHIKP